jgi:hypothetical protein
MDVNAGDMLIFKRKDQLTIKRLKPWRTRECKDDTQYEEIVCGRDWEAGVSLTGRVKSSLPPLLSQHKM